MPLSPRSPSRRALRSNVAAWAFLAPGLLCAAGCGKKGPPLPPLRVLPRPAQNVHVRQLGPEVVLEATISPARTDASPLGTEASVRILRMRPSPSLKPVGVSARYLMVVFQREGKPIATITGADLKTVLAAGGRIVYHDVTAFGPAPKAGAPAAAVAPPRYLYAVQVVDEGGERSAISVPQEIQLVPPPPRPVRLRAETTEGEVRLSWEPGSPGPGASQPAGPAAKEGPLFNVYRRTGEEKEIPLVPLNVAPINETRYVDTRFEYGRLYRYSVRSLPLPPPPLRESVSSDEVEVTPLDVYRPKPPTGLAAAVEGRTIKLYWFPNSEPDLKAYRVYRREAEGDWKLIGEVDGAETSFADTSAARGVRYHYAVTAVDGTTPPNESLRSEDVSESLTADAAPGGKG